MALGRMGASPFLLLEGLSEGLSEHSEGLVLLLEGILGTGTGVLSNVHSWLSS